MKKLVRITEEFEFENFLNCEFIQENLNLKDCTFKNCHFKKVHFNCENVVFTDCSFENSILQGKDIYLLQ